MGAGGGGELGMEPVITKHQFFPIHLESWNSWKEPPSCFAKVMEIFLEITNWPFIRMDQSYDFA